MKSEIKWKEPWKPLEKSNPQLVRELEKELNPKHPLFGKKATPIALGWDGEDILFKLEGDEKLALVHLTWSGKTEPIGFPHTTLFKNWDDFYTNCLLKDHDEYKKS